MILCLKWAPVFNMVAATEDTTNRNFFRDELVLAEGGDMQPHEQYMFVYFLKGRRLMERRVKMQEGLIVSAAAQTSPSKLGAGLWKTLHWFHLNIAQGQSLFEIWGRKTRPMRILIL